MVNGNEVVIRVVGGVGRITLNRPKALHALNQAMCDVMLDALLEWRSNDAVKVVVVDHAKDTRGFCAGGDIAMLAKSGAADGKEATDFFATEYRLNTLIKHFPKPYIAIMDGVTMGGGVGISVHGTRRIATERTNFAMPETGIGLFPDVGGGWFLPRLRGELGTWLALTGARLKGADVVAAGVGTHFVPSELVGNLVSEIERADYSNGAKELLRTIMQPRTKDVPKADFEAYIDVMDTCFAHDSVEEIVLALEADGSDWAIAQTKVLATKSPQTMKVALRQLREGRAFGSFEENMRNEYRIGWRQVRSADFQEGVRAVIFDKDNKPVWPSVSLERVTSDIIDDVFAPLGEHELDLTGLF